MADQTFLFTAKDLTTDRVGEHWMDGRPALAIHPRKYTKPWDDCIPSVQITKDNLPPFYVRLRNDQVGHLVYRIKSQRGILKQAQLHDFWPLDFLQTSGGIDPARESWGKPYTEGGSTNLDVIRSVKIATLPLYVDPCLPLTYTSNHKLMFEGTSGITATQWKAQYKTASPAAASPTLSKPSQPSDASITASLSHMQKILTNHSHLKQKLTDLQTELDFQKAAQKKEVTSLRESNISLTTERDGLLVKLDRKEKECQGFIEEIKANKRVHAMQSVIDAKEAECEKLREEIQKFRDIMRGVQDTFNGVGKGTGHEDAKKKIERVVDGKIVKPKTVVKGGE